MSSFSRNASQALAILAVDNIRLSNAGLDLFSAVDQGEMTLDEAKEAIKARARKYGSTSGIKPSPQLKKL